MLAQGTFEFRVEATGAFAIPPNSSVNNAGGQFFLTGSLFKGDIGWASTSSGGTLFAIRDPAGAMIFPADRIQTEDVGGPFAFGYAFWDERSLSDPQITELTAGDWYLVMSNNEFPNGEVRGQLQLIPEPSTLVLLVLAIIGLALTRRRVYAA